MTRDRKDRAKGDRRWHSAKGWALILLAGFLLGPTGCDEPGSGDALSIDAIGAVAVRLVFDSNGNGTANEGDEVLPGWTVNLDQPAGGTVVSGVTDELGLVIFEEVPVGQLIPAVPEEELGDTLSLVPLSAPPFVLGAFQTAELIPLLTLPNLTVPEVRELAAGIPVFTEGVALNTYREADRSLHLSGEGGFIRVFSVDEGTWAAGDLVRVRGRTLVQDGVPMLDGRAAYRLLLDVEDVVPEFLTTGEAAGARGGTLDAAYVVVQNADILEVVDEGDDGIRLTVDDGSGPLSVRFRAFFNLEPDFVDPEDFRVGYVAGLLVPSRIGDELVWEIQPRNADDVFLIQRVG